MERSGTPEMRKKIDQALKERQKICAKRLLGARILAALSSRPVVAVGYDKLNSGKVGTVAGAVARQECQTFCGRVSTDVKVW
jgi:hypothetical protein